MPLVENNSHSTSEWRIPPGKARFLKEAGFVLAMLSIGAIFAVIALPYQTTYHIEGTIEGTSIDIGPGIFDKWKIVAIAGSLFAVGGIIFAIGHFRSRPIHSKNDHPPMIVSREEARAEAIKAKWQAIAGTAGVSLAIILIGFIMMSLIYHLCAFSKADDWAQYFRGHSFNADLRNYWEVKFHWLEPAQGMLRNNALIFFFMSGAPLALILLGGGLAYLKKKWALIQASKVKENSDGL